MFFSLSKNTRNRKRKRKAPIFIHKLFQNFILKGWIKYFNKYLANQAQNISANEENDDDLKFLNRPVDKKIDDEKRKLLMKRTMMLLKKLIIFPMIIRKKSLVKSFSEKKISQENY